MDEVRTESHSKESRGGKMILWKTICFYALMFLVVFSIVPPAFAQTLLQITGPMQGSYYPLYTEGQTYTITLSGDPSVTNISVTTESAGGPLLQHHK